MRNRKSRRAVRRLPCLEINFMPDGRGGENEEEWTRDEGHRKGEEVAQAFDFNSREEVLHDLNGIRWRDQTL